MKRLLLTGVAALLLAAGTAHADELCAVVRKLRTLNEFLAVRDGPGVQNKMISTLYKDMFVHISAAGDEPSYVCTKPKREYTIFEADLRDLRHCRNLWVHVTVDPPVKPVFGVPPGITSGWINAKYIRQYPCKEPEYIPTQNPGEIRSEDLIPGG